MAYAVGGDVLLFISLFVLGGDFWNKLQALFLHDATAVIPERPSGNSDLVVAARGCLGIFPRIFDWDRDGRRDLVVGLADGYIEHFPNIATDDNPQFGAGEYLQFGEPGLKVDINVGARATFDITDWNNRANDRLFLSGERP